MAGPKAKRTIIDLFAGVGGLSLGFVEHGYELIYGNDNDYWALKTLQKNHKKSKFTGQDIREISIDNIRKDIKNRHVNVLVAGIPCQSFSMAGYRIRKNRRGIYDDRNQNFCVLLMV
jgi:site-specific DNA-cytosine methylase